MPRCRHGPPTATRPTTRRPPTSTTTISCRAGVGDVREAPVGGDCGVARRAELAGDRVHAQVGVDEGQPPACRVGDERADHADALDASRVGGVRSRRCTLPVGRSTATMLDSRSAVTSASGVPPLATGERGCRAQEERGSGSCEELAPVHALSTSSGVRRGPGLRSAAQPYRWQLPKEEPMRRLFLLAVLLLVPAAHAATGPTNGCPAPCSGQVSSPDGLQIPLRAAGRGRRQGRSL